VNIGPWITSHSCPQTPDGRTDGRLRDFIFCPMHMHSIGQTIKLSATNTVCQLLQRRGLYISLVQPATDSRCALHMPDVHAHIIVPKVQSSQSMAWQCTQNEYGSEHHRLLTDSSGIRQPSPLIEINGGDTLGRLNVDWFSWMATRRRVLLILADSGEPIRTTVYWWTEHTDDLTPVQSLHAAGIHVDAACCHCMVPLHRHSVDRPC